jgi:hypothetical protein
MWHDLDLNRSEANHGKVSGVRVHQDITEYEEVERL